MIDREQIYIWWKTFQDNGRKLCEIRCLDGQRTYSGYYHNIDNLIRDIEPLSERPNMQIYFVLNTIKEDCYDRQQQERMVEKPKNTTTDADIEGRNFILLDFDPERPSGVGSTDEQLKDAHTVAKKVYTFLIEQGFSSLIVCKSGNGIHCLVPIKLANSAENTKLVERFLKAIAMLFNTETVHVDTKVGNASRICKLYGTYAKKGSNTSDHPWRLAKFWKTPDEIIPNNREYIEKIADLYKDERPAPSRENNYGQSRFDVEDFLNRYGLEYRSVRTGLGTRYILKECPFDGNHKDPDSMVFQYDSGAIEFFCYHNSCQHYHWKDFRLHFEPDAYDKKDYKEFQYKQRYYEKYTVPTEIKQETDELGKKWLSLRDIKLVKDSERFSIKTGIYALDKAIGGLFESETTLLSGINASGKTAILNQIILNACQRDIPCGLWSGELPATRIKSWICQTAAGKQNVTKVEGRDNAYEVNDNVIGKIEDWIDERLVIYNNNYGSNSEQILSDVEEAVKKYNLKLVLLDNLMALSLDDLVGTMNEKQKALMIKLDALAKKYHIHILIIAHPRKEANFQLLRKESISGTSDLTNIVWNVLLIHRVGDDFEKRATEFWGKERTNKLILEGYNNIIEIAKNRDYGVVDFVVGLFYEIETKRFKNSKAEQIHYDWEEHYEEYTAYEEPQPLPTAIQPNQSFDTPIEPLYPDNDNDTYWVQFDHDTEPPF